MTKSFGEDTCLKGIPLSRGLAVAKVCLFNEQRHSKLPAYRIKPENIPGELVRVRQAIELAAKNVEEVKQRVVEQMGAPEGEIFTAQQMILEDANIMEKVLSLVGESAFNAENAIQNVFDEYEAKISALDNEYIRERATDLGEVKRRILDVLGNLKPSFNCAGTDHCRMGRDRLVVAHELSPSLTVELNPEHALGFVTERGGINSHAAILARAMGIPAVSGLPKIHELITCGTTLLVDGDRGEVVVAPTEATIARYRSYHEQKAEEVVSERAVEPLSVFKVMANISVAWEVRDALAMLADGVGLYRTEFEFMAAGRRLTEDEQYERYAGVVKAFRHKPVTFRLLDMGGDKNFAFLKLPSELNPALGLRGARLLLAQRDFLEDQARALARASQHGPIRVLYPMIVDVEQFLRLKELFLAAIAGIKAGSISHGVMFEVPSACWQAQEMMAVADFASVGTNDLSQYLFALDRDNERVTQDYRPDHPVLWSFLEKLAVAARTAGKPLAICGELASLPAFTPRLVDIGMGSVSVAPRLISAVRRAARESLKVKEKAGRSRKI